MRPAASTTVPEPMRSAPRMRAEACDSGMRAWRWTVEGSTRSMRPTAAFTGPTLDARPAGRKRGRERPATRDELAGRAGRGSIPPDRVAPAGEERGHACSAPCPERLTRPRPTPTIRRHARRASGAARGSAGGAREPRRRAGRVPARGAGPRAAADAPRLRAAGAAPHPSRRAGRARRPARRGRSARGPRAFRRRGPAPALPLRKRGRLPGLRARPLYRAGARRQTARTRRAARRPLPLRPGARLRPEPRAVHARVRRAGERVRPVARAPRRPRARLGRAAGNGRARDAALAAELEADAKERAEHVMIVDLERNDLGRVAAIGSVAVEAYARVESHPTVHHLVSSVVGRVRPDVGLARLLRATFPGGSITGAPKVRAMEIIRELEPVPRGAYTGAFGLFHPSGDLELGLAIRTAVISNGVVRYHAGGGIVADSDPERELAEAWLKTAALRLALGEDVRPELERCSSG